MGGGGTQGDAGDSLELSCQQSRFLSCRHDITTITCWDPQSHLARCWCPCGHWPQPLSPWQTEGVGAPICRFLEIPLILASSSMSLLVKILPCSGYKKKRVFVSLFIPKLLELAALWPRVAGNMGFGLWGPCQVLTIDQVCGWENNSSRN